MENQWKSVGKVKDAHSLKGELFILIFSEDISWMNDLEKFVLQKNGEEQTYTVVSIKPHKNGFILKSKEITDRTQAEKLKGRLFLIPENLLISEPGETIFMNEILGFTVKTVQGDVIGQLEQIWFNGVYDMLVVKNETKMFEIPFVENFIKDTDFENKILTMELPPGLLEVNEKL